jgi:hypothetical protein
MKRRHLLWLSIPALGLAELGAYAYFSKRAPSVSEWNGLRPVVAELRNNDEVVVVAPRWAEPLARHALGDELMPLSQVARPDISVFRRALEIGTLGDRAPELESWRVIVTRRHGNFKLWVRENPAPAHVTFPFVDRLGPEHASVTEGDQSCPWDPSARVTAGGLGGDATFPSERFECSSGPRQMVGVTVIDDEQYRARRCIWAHPSPLGPLRIQFRNVVLGDRIYGYTGMQWLLVRDGVGGSVELELRIAGQNVGRVVHPDKTGWRQFEVAVGERAGETADVEFVVRSDSPQNRPLCFYADARWSRSPG